MLKTYDFYEARFWAIHEQHGYDVAEEELRRVLIGYLMFNDKHGCYADDDRRGENFEPLTTIGALENVLHHLQETNSAWEPGQNNRGNKQ